MKAFLLAAGHGTRLRPLTDHVPKCLLPIRGTPILAIWLRLCRDFGIDEVLVNIHSHANLIREFLTSRCELPRVDVVEEATLLGSAGTLIANRAWVASETFFWVFYADVLTNLRLLPMLEMHKARNPAATLATYNVTDPGNCGIIELDLNGAVSRFVEKPVNPRSTLAFAGVLIGTHELLNAIPKGQPTDLGFDVLPHLTGRMVAYPIRDYLVDIGTADKYQWAQATWPGLESELTSPNVTRNCV